ncbi:MAG: hypothetical protein GY765_13275, partial [bacterium]|nr:hypothetical protein [bacterium]
KEVLKQSSIFIIIMAVLPALLYVVSRSSGAKYMEIVSISLAIGSGIFIFFLGNSLFMTDRKQRAVDYVFSLPYSRLQLLWMKILPRFAAALFFSSVYLLVARPEKGIAAILLIYLAIFVVAVSLSASVENYLVMAVLTGAGLFVFLMMMGVSPLTRLFKMIFAEMQFGMFSSGYQSFDGSVLQMGTIFLLLLLPFAAAFVTAFKKVGLKPTGYYNKQFAKIFVPAIVGVLIINAYWLYSLIPAPHTDYYMTKQGDVLECTNIYSRVHTADGVSEVKGEARGAFSNILGEDDQYVYGTARAWYGSLYEKHDSWFEKLFIEKVDTTKVIARMNKKTLTSEVLYTFTEKEKQKNHWLFKGYPALFGDTIAFIKHDPLKVNYLVLLNAKSGKKTRIRVAHTGYVQYILGANVTEAGRFWILACSSRDENSTYGFSIYRLGENGDLQYLAESTYGADYINGMLLTRGHEDMTFSRITESGLETVKTLPITNHTSFRRYWWVQGARWSGTVKYLYGSTYIKEQVTHLCLDMETFEIKTMPQLEYSVREGVRYGILNAMSNTPCLLKHEKDGKTRNITFFRLKGTEREKMKTLEDVLGLGVSPHGMVAVFDGDIHTFSFPDFTEAAVK